MRGTVKTRLPKLPEVPKKLSNIGLNVKTDDPIFAPILTDNGAFAELTANVPNDVHGVRRHTITSRCIVKLDFGFSLEIPSGYRCGIVLKPEFAARGLVITNSPAYIKSGERFCVNVANLGKEILIIDHGSRIAQMFIEPIYLMNFNKGVA